MTHDGPWKIDPRAVRVLTYIQGKNGEPVTAWFNGQSVGTSALEVRGDESFGSVTFDIPAGATMFAADHVCRRVLFT